MNGISAWKKLTPDYNSGRQPGWGTGAAFLLNLRLLNEEQERP